MTVRETGQSESCLPVKKWMCSDFQAQQEPIGCFERQLGKHVSSIGDESLGTALTVR